MRDARPVVVVGTGLSGLACALRLEAAGLPVRLLEAGHRPGGRVRTDTVGGFRLDRGFRVFPRDALAPVGTAREKLRLGRYAMGLRGGSLADALEVAQRLARGSGAGGRAVGGGSPGRPGGPCPRRGTAGAPRGPASAGPRLTA